MSDEDEVCENSGERIHPRQVIMFKKNKQIQDDEDDDDGEPESFKETMQIPEQDLDHTAYDNYTYKYGTLRKPSSLFESVLFTETTDSSHASYEISTEVLVTFLTHCFSMGMA